MLFKLYDIFKFLQICYLYICTFVYIKYAGKSYVEKEIIKAVKENNLRKIKYLKKHGAYIRDKLSYALGIAIKNDNLEMIHYISKNSDNEYIYDTILMDAACHGNLKVVKYAYENGGNICVMNNEPLKASSRNGYLDIVKYLHKNGANMCDNKYEAFRYAALNGHLDVVKYLLHNGANINANKGDAIIEASYNGRYDVVVYLCENGADITKRNNMVYQAAITFRHLNIIEYLDDVKKEK